MSTPHHIDQDGNARMVDVGQKNTTHRRAMARGVVHMSNVAFDQLAQGAAAKGDVLSTARIAGIMAAKKTSELIPLCHQVALSSVKITFEPDPRKSTLGISCVAQALGQTGVEMEALTGVSVAALTIYDMLKSIDKSMRIGEIELIEKDGGKSGSYRRPIRVVEKSSPASSPPTGSETAPSNEPQNGLKMDTHGADVSEQKFAKIRTPLPTPSPEAVALSRLVSKLDSDCEELCEFLLREPLASAYMLGDLDGPYREHCDWYGLKDKSLSAVLLLYSGLSMPAVLAKGDPADIEALLAASYEELPRRFYAHIRIEHREPIECFYTLSDVKPMLRMGLSRVNFKTKVKSAAEVLSHRDTAEIMQLYQQYPDNFFEPAQLDTGLYFGKREEGKLISVAGLHVCSTRYNVAAIGNIVTHEEHRGRGFASDCVGALLVELFKRVEHVALNVSPENHAAIACYKKFGFEELHPFIEGWATAR